jgi:disulfide bond formation protein DsbB
MMTQPISPDPKTWQLLFVAWIVAMASTLSAIFIGEIMGQSPCVLCWHQRIFMFPLAIILAVASYRSDTGIWRYALPISAIGWIIAAYHTLLYVGVLPTPIIPCGIGPSCSSADMTILGGIPLPMLSLVGFTTITILLIKIARRPA